MALRSEYYLIDWTKSLDDIYLWGDEVQRIEFASSEQHLGEFRRRMRCPSGIKWRRFVLQKSNIEIICTWFYLFNSKHF